MERHRNDWLTVKKASELLGMDCESVRTLAEEGLIRRLSEGDKMYVHRIDVEHAAKIHGSTSSDPVELTRRVMVLERTVERLRESINLVYEINGMVSSKFERMSNQQLISLYLTVQNESKLDRWPLERIFNYCEIYLRISEMEIEKLNQELKIKDSWKPFYLLCLMQLKYIGKHKTLKTNLDIQRCKDILCRGKNNLRDIAIVFIELEGQKKSSMDLLCSMASSDIDSFDHLIKQMKKRNIAGRLELL